MADQSKPYKDEHGNWCKPSARLNKADRSKPISELTVKVNIDCSDALKGLKAVQREARKATQALKELNGWQDLFDDYTEKMEQ